MQGTIVCCLSDNAVWNWNFPTHISDFDCFWPQILNSIISHGCFLRECSVEHCIVGVRSRLEYGAELKVTCLTHWFYILYLINKKISFHKCFSLYGETNPTCKVNTWNMSSCLERMNIYILFLYYFGRNLNQSKGWTESVFGIPFFSSDSIFFYRSCFFPLCGRFSWAFTKFS